MCSKNLMLPTGFHRRSRHSRTEGKRSCKTLGDTVAQRKAAKIPLVASVFAPCRQLEELKGLFGSDQGISLFTPLGLLDQLSAITSDLDLIPSVVGEMRRDDLGGSFQKRESMPVSLARPLTGTALCLHLPRGVCKIPRRRHRIPVAEFLYGRRAYNKKRCVPIEVDELGEGLIAYKSRDILGTNWQVSNYGKRAGKGACNSLRSSPRTFVFIFSFYSVAILSTCRTLSRSQVSWII